MKESWQTGRLGDVCRVIPGYAFKSSDWQQNGIPVVKIKNITGHGSVDLSEVDCVPESIFTPKLQKFVLGDGDILVAMTGATAGKVGKVRTDKPILLNQRVARIVPVNADADFIWSVVSSQEYQERFFYLADGAAQPNMSGAQIEGVEIPLPPLPAQQRIAGILSAYDELIENCQRRIKILEQMARGLYREWFVNFRFPNHAKTPTGDSPLGKIPKGWEVLSIGEVCDRVTDGSHFSPKSVDEGMPMASSKDMHDWGLTMETCRCIRPEDFDNLVRNDCKPKRHDVLITKDGANYLKHVFVNREERDVVLLSSIAILRANGRINPHLLAAILSSPETKDRLKNYVTGAAIPRIILKDFKRFQFVLPSNPVQKEWAKIAEPITGQCWRLVDQIQNLRKTRDLLLPRLMSGQINVN